MKFTHRKWLYHADLDPVIVQSQRDCDALGEGWVESPVEVTKSERPSIEPAEPAKKTKAKQRKSDGDVAE